MDNRKLLYRVPEAGALLSWGRAKSYAEAKKGTLPTLLIGGTLRVPAVALERLITEKMAEAGISSEDAA